MPTPKTIAKSNLPIDPQSIRVQASRGLAALEHDDEDEPRVDRAKGMIRGFTVMEKGPARGHDFDLDDATLDRVVELGQAAARGVKMRFTHPNLSGDGLGKYLGRASNFRRDGDRVLADMKLSRTAYKTPHGDLASYVLDLAAEEPDQFGASASLKHQLEERRNLDGTQMRGEDDEPLAPVCRPELLRAVDFVDTPAAAPSGLFSAEGLPDWAAREATALLDSYFSAVPDQVVAARIHSFTNTYLRHRGIQMSNAPTQPDPSKPAAEQTQSEVQTSAPAASALSEAAASDHQEAALAERKRIRELETLCKRAGCSELAMKLIDDGTSLADARNLVLERMLAKQTVLGDDATSDLAETPDPDAAFKKEFRDERELFLSLGMTEESYVSSRRVDEGLEPLVPTKR